MFVHAQGLSSHSDTQNTRVFAVLPVVQKRIQLCVRPRISQFLNPSYSA